jgi:hypothetical protein
MPSRPAAKLSWWVARGRPSGSICRCCSATSGLVRHVMSSTFYNLPPLNSRAHLKLK